MVLNQSQLRNKRVDNTKCKSNYIIFNFVFYILTSSGQYFELNLFGGFFGIIVSFVEVNKMKFLYRSRHELGSSKSSEKLGKSLSKIKHGVLGKSIEGIVDNSVMDSAFNLADMYVSESNLLS